MGPGTRCLPIRQRNQAGVRSLREVNDQSINKYLPRALIM